MDEEEALARLVALAGTSAAGAAGAAGTADAALLRAVVEEASELGARRALARLGLADEAARDDIGDLRQLLGAWRDAKKSVWAAVVDWAVRGALALVVVGLAVKLGLPGLLK
ncbi:DUF6127 family protein [Sphingopyxis indica]|uniref:Uncharacterized protein n=1 Tax=Sphingopyxis indica TaxID=436663 RepID=A0A239JKK9_9SPHN|nr:DUF6127 family protein [Sphingopyxis indica]SNT05948.1 hypothetical protein SAMN06295955_110112 [Sphingopyxis indica]